MKRLIQIVIILVLGSTLCEAQYINSKVLLGAEAVLAKPVGPKTSDGFSSLFANYSSGIGYSAQVEVETLQQLFVGLEFTQINFGNTLASAEYLMKNPSSRFTMVYGSIRYFVKSPLVSKLNYSFSASGGMVNHDLSMDRLIVSSEQEVEEPTEYKDNSWGGKVGAMICYDVHQSIQTFAEVGYSYIQADHVLYADKSFQSLSLSLGINVKLFKNKYFMYE
ncbi:hypothetical protein [Reichenbachiella ulvae]|uniref:Outer membrane protein beta-barrel domain-containing protein n=1 Tax=Reichenbachiella ulvae TaxID=2980104 RepID=A0ABT3CSQ0_9BACT|nr:hypothetical protein [Reichenbachiella ulvae]MCV9386740.1 hypothetical protein [Reichenbachiella ulvae]